MIIFHTRESLPSAMRLFRDKRFEFGEVIQIEVGEICGRIKYKVSYAATTNESRPQQSKPLQNPPNGMDPFLTWRLVLRISVAYVCAFKRLNR